MDYKNVLLKNLKELFGYDVYQNVEQKEAVEAIYKSI